MTMRCSTRSFSIVFFFFTTMELRASGAEQRMISTPNKPTRVFIGKNVSLVWQYYQPSHLKLRHVLFGFFKWPGLLIKELMEVTKTGIAYVAKGYQSRLSWVGNLTSSLAVFVLHNVQPEDQNKKYGIQVDFGYEYNMLTDTVQLKVEPISNADIPRITNVTTPALLRIGQNMSLYCTASGLSPVKITWYKGNKALANGFSQAVFTLRITDKDWGDFLCVAENSFGVDKKTVFLKVLPESPTILNTNKTVRNASWTMRWSAVYSEGHLVMLYTVWHRVVHVTKDSATIKEPWVRENVTGFMNHRELSADTSYMFAVTAWNSWGESLLERDKMLSISTDFPDRTTTEIDMVSSGPGSPTTPSREQVESNEVSDFTLRNEVFIWGALAAFVCIFLPVVIICIVRRKQKRRREKNLRHQHIRRVTLASYTSEEDLTSEAAQDTADRSASIILSDSASLTTSASPPVLQQPAESVRNMQGGCNQPGTGECGFVLAASRPEINTITPGSTSNEMFTLFAPNKGSERSKHNQEIRMSVIHKATTPEPTPEEENRIAIDTRKVSELGHPVPTPEKENSIGRDTKEVCALGNPVPTPEENNGIFIDTEEVSALDAIREIDQKTRKSQVSYEEDYLRPVDIDNVQGEIKKTGTSRLCNERSQFLSPNHPQAKPRSKVLGKRRKDKCKHSTFTGTYHGQQHGYQNEKCTTTPTYQNAPRPVSSVETPYTRVLSNANWEVSRDHLSLSERIGGGSFGQVWRGAVLGMKGDQEWSDVAVKMLKENSSNTDLKDLLSELDLLKKLKPHPNVIQLLGCLTKDVIRKGGREFRPPLVILEFVPHGDLLGYLKKSRGETDDYYNLKGANVPRKIPVHQLYKFAYDIARGMEFISAHQLIHRDLAARNVLVGEGLRCKITDFGMARDLGKAEVYVRRSNGLMPVKWMAVESLTSEVFTTKSDVWSYGIVLYEIFTLGRNPYKGMTGEEVFNFVASGRRLPRTSGITSELYNLMLECWYEDPTKRPTFGSVAAMMET